MRSLRLLFPWCARTTGIAGAALHLLDALAAHPVWSRQFAPEYWLTSADSKHRRSYQQALLPHGIARIVHRLAGEPSLLRRRVVRRYLNDLRPGDIAWLFPSLGAEVYHEAKQRGCFVIKEVVNTALPAHREALVRAHAVLGWQPERLPPEAEIADEVARVRSADALFSCSAWTDQSLLAIGARPEQLLPSSYGWDPATFRPVARRSERPRFLFVANGIVRKGLPHLLRAWAEAAPAATLVVVGNLAPVVAERCAAELARADVEYHPHSGDLAAHYGHADAFVLPSFEEGSPLVTYLAMAAGLPCLLSPEAAGWVVRDGEEGLLAPPGDQDAWVELLRRVAEDRPLREQLGARGLERSREYTWERALQRRCEALHRRLGEAEVGLRLPAPAIAPAPAPGPAKIR
jgi:glycosyltransferase involved in cell wall biosynthesis